MAPYASAPPGNPLELLAELLDPLAARVPVRFHKRHRALRSDAAQAEAAKAEALLATMIGAALNTLLVRPGELDLVGTIPWCPVAAINGFFFSFLGVRRLP